MKDKDLNEDEIREMIRQILSEDYFSSSTADVPSYSYTTDEPDTKSHTYKPEETIYDKARNLGLPYSPILNKFNEEDLELLSNLTKRFKKTGNMELKYKAGWQGPLFAYLVEYLGAEGKGGNQKALLKLEEIFNPLNSEDLWMNLVRSYNKTDSANKRGTLINKSDSPEVKEAMGKFIAGRVILKHTDKYFKKGGNDYLLKYLLKNMQLRFYNNYELQFKRAATKAKPSRILKRPELSGKQYASTYSISDIQKYLYSGNDEESINDNFMKFNQANKEAIAHLKANNINPKHLAAIDGIIVSKLDPEEVMKVNPKMFKDNKDVTRNFGQALRVGKVAGGEIIGDYLDGLYKKYGLELPTTKKWAFKDIASSQDPTKKLKDDSNALFEQFRKIIKEELGILFENEDSEDIYDDDYDGEEESNEDIENQWSNSFEGLTPEQKKLLSVFEEINGVYAIAPGETENQFLTDPNVGIIADKGRYYGGENKIQAPIDCGFEYQHGGCHVNSFRLYGRGLIDKVVMGYAYIPKNRGWAQHFWGIKDGKIVETTPIFMDAKDYVGVMLGPKSIVSFGNRVIKQFSPNEIDTWYNR